MFFQPLPHLTPNALLKWHPYTDTFAQGYGTSILLAMSDLSTRTVSENKDFQVSLLGGWEVGQPGFQSGRRLVGGAIAAQKRGSSEVVHHYLVGPLMRQEDGKYVS